MNSIAFDSKLRTMPFCELYTAHGTTMEYCLEHGVIGLTIELGSPKVGFKDDEGTVQWGTKCLERAVLRCLSKMDDWIALPEDKPLSLARIHRALEKLPRYRGYLVKSP